MELERFANERILSNVNVVRETKTSTLRHNEVPRGTVIDRGLSDREIMDELLKANGPLLLRPHLKP